MSKIVEKIPHLGSSVNSKQLALTVKGILTAIAPLILALSGLYGWNIGEEMLHEFIEAVIQVINSVGLAVGSVMTLYGAGRRIYYKVKK